MDKQVAKKWVRALRSGKFKQGKGRLQNKSRFCCLGVLCELAKKEGITVLHDFNGDILGQSLFDQPNVHKWSKIYKLSGGGRIKSLRTNLASLNDGESYIENFSGRLTFDEIADLIQINWKEL